jgi:hypothetical protein
MRALGALAVAGGLVVSTGTMAASAAFADSQPPPTKDGCPQGYQLLDVAHLELISNNHYALAAYVDSTGNDNGQVCGNQLPPDRQQAFCNKEGPGSPVCELMALGLPSYGFIDDVIRGQGGIKP